MTVGVGGFDIKQAQCLLRLQEKDGYKSSNALSYKSHEWLLLMIQELMGGFIMNTGCEIYCATPLNLPNSQDCLVD